MSTSKTKTGKILIKKINKSSGSNVSKGVSSGSSNINGATVCYYGEHQCQSKIKSTKAQCTNMAYYTTASGGIFCGVHSDKTTRLALAKNPNAKQDRALLLKQRQELVEQAAKDNRQKGIKGQIVLSKLRMMKEPEHIDGFLKVFPNFKHGGRTDGFGCPSLSPKSMGPIDHGQPGLPVALNLENFHQGNKVFPSEVDAKGHPKKSFYDTQVKMYLDPVPHRHKEEAKKGGVAGNKNVPQYAIWKRKDGTEFRCDYLESRQFYCNFYERIATVLPDFKKLQGMIDQGYNLQIIGYDAYPVAAGKSLESCYLDTSKPFGHELVLYCMLVEQDPNNYPWRKYKTEDF